MKNTGIASAVEMIGSQHRLARELGVTQQAVCEWVKQGFAPNGRVHDILDLVDPDCVKLNAADLMDPDVVELVQRGSDEQS
jgi:predicted transcriptional regulator